MTSRYIPQLSFSFYRHRAIRADFSGGQITSDAGLLPLRAFDQRYELTRGLAERVCDDRNDSRVSHPGLSLLRQRLYQIIAGYEDANDADRLRHDSAFQILADQPLGEPLGSRSLLHRQVDALGTLGNELVARSIADYVEAVSRTDPSFPNRTRISMRWVIIGSFAAWLSSRG